jgi:site-specific recombinase XerD
MVIGINMQNIQTDIKTLEIETLKNLSNSKSKNTLRAYKSDFDNFAAFCISNGFNYLPTQPQTVALYLTKISKTSKFSTLKRRIASISVIHKLKGHYLDVKHPIIIENLHGIKRNIGTRQLAKKPILINNLKLLINVINNNIVNITELNQLRKEKFELIKSRDKALILIGFAGGFRRSELINIEYNDIEFVDEGVKILVKKSKTDQSGEGHIKAIPYFDNKNYCPVLALKNYIRLKFINRNQGMIFDISDKSVALIVKKYAEKAGLDASKYAGHSLRSGFATSAADFGVEERNIMAMTGHKTTQMVRRYIQEANLFKNNPLNKFKI